ARTGACRPRPRCRASRACGCPRSPPPPRPGRGAPSRDASSWRAQKLDELLGRRREVLALAMDDPDRPQEDLVGELHHGERLLAHLRSHRRLGQEGEALPDLDQALHGLDVVQLHDVAYLRTMAAQQAIGLLAGGNVALEAHEMLARELADDDLAVARQRVAGRAHEHQPVLAEGQDGDPRLARGIGHDAEVDVAARGVVVDLAGTGVFEAEVDLREGLQVALERSGQLVEADGVHRRDAHRAAHHPGRRLELTLHLLEALDDVLARLVEDLARGRELYVAARALEEA